MRVLLVNDGASPHTGGMNRMVAGTCDALSRAGHAVGLVGLEAMAHGKPSVAFGGGGVDEWLCPGETGLRVESRTAEAFAAALGGLLVDPARCATMGEEARRRFPPFRPEVYVERLCQAFERAIGWFAATAIEGPVAS